MKSTSSINNKEYPIPSILDDKKNIDSFIQSNKDKKIVVVQGLGFVGAVMSIVCANSMVQEYAVIGVDLPNKDTYWKIASINDGIFPVISSDNKVDEFFKNTISKNNFIATYDPYAYSLADIIIVDINLDVKKHSSSLNDLEDFEVDLGPFKKGIEVISKNCKEDSLILIETTVPPGTTEKIVKPIIKDGLGRRDLAKEKIKIGHSYERVMPGPNYIDSIINFYRVYSGIDEESSNAVELFLKTIVTTDDYPLTRLSNTNATEMAKVLENSFRAMNIAFIVEWSRFAEEANVNLYDVVNAIRMRPTHKNIMLPGIGVGGYCLTKDPLLASWSRKNLFNSEKLASSEHAVKVNDKMPYDCFTFIKSQYKETLEDKTFLLFGVSYAPDIGDTRYTPVEWLYRFILEEKPKILLHDPFLSYWDEMNISISSDINEYLSNQIDCVIFSTGHTEYRNNSMLIKKLQSLDNLFIIDTIGVLNDREILSLNEKHIVKVLGRGDI